MSTAIDIRSRAVGFGDMLTWVRGVEGETGLFTPKLLCERRWVVLLALEQGSSFGRAAS